MRCLVRSHLRGILLDLHRLGSLRVSLNLSAMDLLLLHGTLRILDLLLRIVALGLNCLVVGLLAMAHSRTHENWASHYMLLCLVRVRCRIFIRIVGMIIGLLAVRLK